MLPKALLVFLLCVLGALAVGQGKPLVDVPAQAQEPNVAAQPVRPALTVLFDKSKPVAADDLRRRLKNLVGVDLDDKAPKQTGTDVHWLTAHKGGLIGSLAGHGFRVHFEAKPIELTEKTCGHLDPDAIAAMKKHTANAVIELQGSFDADSKVDDYEVLGAIACGLLRRGALAISAREFGTLERVDADMRESLLESPVLDVLRPVEESTLVVFLSKPRELTEQSLQKAMAKEFPKLFGKGGAGFVVVREGMTVVGLNDAVVVLTFNPKAKIDPDSLGEMRVRKAIKDHQVMLHMWTSGAIDAKAERQRQQHHARIAAALWQDDCLALSWYCNLAIVPAHTDLLEQLRAADPVAKTLDVGVVPVVEAVDEKAMEKAIAMARKTWPEAWKKSQSGVQVSAKFPFPTRAGSVEHIWVSVAKVAGDQVQGTIGNEPVDIEGVELGSEVTCKLSELSDWIYFENGEVIGGFTVKVLQKQAAADKKK